jgi:hypothetical protein
MESPDDFFEQTRCYAKEHSTTVPGITFHLSSRHRWFLPYSGLIHATLNPEETRLRFHYALWIVTIVGTELVPLHEAAAAFQLQMVRPSPSPLPAGETTVSQIETTGNADFASGEAPPSKTQSRLKAYSTASRHDRPSLDPKYLQPTPYSPPPKAGEGFTR